MVMIGKVVVEHKVVFVCSKFDLNVMMHGVDGVG
jgi:hypothetical protein